ncbi:RNA-directed DNA polymerase from mobile element jockey [Lucilia cuprina]|nr:RNA-directed DNA polymerase from mobile element jockey [Lucilia cuprina]
MSIDRVNIQTETSLGFIKPKRLSNIKFLYLVPNYIEEIIPEFSSSILYYLASRIRTFEVDFADVVVGCDKNSTIKHIEVFQNKVLRHMVNAPWYVRNHDLHPDLGVEFVRDVVKKFAISHHQKLSTHVNSKASRLNFIHSNA